MKVLVPVKRVLDFNLKVRVKPDGSGVDLAAFSGRWSVPPSPDLNEVQS